MNTFRQRLLNVVHRKIKTFRFADQKHIKLTKGLRRLVILLSVGTRGGIIQPQSCEIMPVAFVFAFSALRPMQHQGNSRRSTPWRPVK